MKRLLLIVAIATVLATGLSFTAAQLWLKRSRPAPNLAHLLDLTPDQARQLAAADTDYQRTVAEGCKKHCAARYDFGNELVKPDPRDAAGCVERMCAAQTEMERATFAHILRVREFLTPAQREKYVAVLRDQVCNACPMGMHQP
jgi:hypothetical protein